MDMEDSPEEAEHKSAVYFIEHSKEFGRFLVAAKDIDARTEIIFEPALVSGAADDGKSTELGDIPVCLGCYKRMQNFECSRCGKCGWPVCGPACEAAETHSKNECGLFCAHQVTYPCRHSWPVLSKTILVLRTLLLKYKCKRIWDSVIMKMEHHTEIRQTKSQCKSEDDMILENFLDFYKCDQLDTEMSNDVVRISGVISVNAFSTTKSNEQGNDVRIVQCIYPEASLLAHSCIPNCSWTIDTGSPELPILIRAAIPIKRGEMITIAYNLPETMSGTLHRLISTEDVAHFICCCRRCKDPTELGTFVSGIKCFHCEKNYLLPIFPTNPESDWRCRGCGSLQSVPKIVLFLNQIEESYELIKRGYYSREKEVKKLEIFLKIKGELLHVNHYILQEVRMRIISLQVQSLESLEEPEVVALINHCRFMLEIASTLIPGFNKRRALLQFYWSQGLLQLISFKKSNPFDESSTEEAENEEKEIQFLYKQIYSLQTRALLYFSDQHSNPGSISGARQFAKCIKKQLQNVERHIY